MIWTRNKLGRRLGVTGQTIGNWVRVGKIAAPTHQHGTLTVWTDEEADNIVRQYAALKGWYEPYLDIWRMPPK